MIQLIERAARGERIRACVSMPPRHGKTTLINHAFAWWLAHSPADTHAYFSYNETQGRSKSRLARALALLAGVKLAEDSASLSEWRTLAGGGMLAGGIGGGLTGQGVSGLMVIDDPFKNRVEADSALRRETVWEWFTEVPMTRLEGASVLVVQTRWHPDDLVGRLEQMGGWEIVNLPALAEPDDTLGRSEGEALWPDRYPADALDATRRVIGEYSWASLYQGRPRPRGAKVFGPPHYYDPKLVDLTGARIVIGGDPAATKKTASDYAALVALAIIGRDPSTMRGYVREVYREQREVPQFMADMKAFQARHGNAPVKLEAVGGFKAIPQMIKHMDSAANIAEASVFGDKFTRAQGLAAAWNDGRVLVPLGTEDEFPWMKDFLAEFKEFTGVNDAHDDQVDAGSHAWNDDTPPVPSYQRTQHKTSGGRWDRRKS